MLTKAYEAQCRATKLSPPPPAQERRRGFALFALALGSFVIGTSEFASMGILQIFSANLHITVPVATHAITGYALGVLLGAPVVTLAAARLNRRTLLLGLISLFIVGNLLSAAACRKAHISAQALSSPPISSAPHREAEPSRWS